MNRKTLEKFRSALKDQRQNILEWFDPDSGHVAHFFGKVDGDDGYPLSQQKLQKISDINYAIDQIDKGNFGRCKLCSGEVETERLAFNFTEDICLDHYTESQKRDLENDLELAAKVHRNLLPSAVPVIQGIEIAAHSEPARIVGGDYYDFFCFQNYMQGLVIADVMGKGLPASMLMSNLQASLRILGPENDEIEKTVTRLNELFKYNLKLIRFISLIIVKIDNRANILHYVNAGHHPPLWWENATQTVHDLNPTGPAIGLVPDAKFTSEQIRFHPGDLFLLYTDGLVEATNQTREEFGEERLHEYLQTHSRDSALDLLEGLKAKINGFSHRLQDDLTILIIKIK